MAENVTDIRDTRTLIPRLRRAIEGPTGTGSTLSDEQLNAIGADAIASVIFYSDSSLGKLEVAARDAKYMSPTAWIVDPPLTDPQVTAIVSQAALDYFYMALSTTRTAETTADESTNWQWEISPQALVERLRQLRADRDLALEQLNAEGEAMDASYVSFIGVRDNWTSRLIEPWVEHGGVAQGGLNPLEFV